MPPPDGNAPAEGSQQQASGPQTPPQHSQSKSYMRDAAVPIPEEGPLLQENLSAPAGLPQPVAPRSPLSQPQVPESPVSVGLVQPQHPAAPLGEPLHPHEDADEKVCCHSVRLFYQALCIQDALPCKGREFCVSMRCSWKPKLSWFSLHLTSAALLLHWLSECAEPARTRGCSAIAAAIRTSSIT